MTWFLFTNISIFSTVVTFSRKIKTWCQTGEMRENRKTEGCCEEGNGEKRSHLIAVGGFGTPCRLHRIQQWIFLEKTEKHRDEKSNMILGSFPLNSFALETVKPSLSPSLQTHKERSKELYQSRRLLQMWAAQIERKISLGQCHWKSYKANIGH